MTWLLRLTLHLALLVAAVVTISSAARAQSSTGAVPEWLVGWWLDEQAYAQLVHDGLMTPHLGLMIIDAAGNVEERAARLDIPTVEFCRMFKICTDAPLVWSSTVRSDGQNLIFSNSVPSATPIDTPSGDTKIRDLAVAKAQRWTYSWNEAEEILVLSRSGSEDRIFFAIDPDSWRRALALQMLPTEIGGCGMGTPYGEWTPDHADQKLARAASYFRTLKGYYMSNGLSGEPVEPKELLPEFMLLEKFDDLHLPVTKEIQASLNAKYFYLRSRALGASEAEIQEVVGRLHPGINLKIGLTAEEVELLGQAGLKARQTLECSKGGIFR